MKKYIAITAFMLLASLLFACSSDMEIGNMEKVTMTAVVKNVSNILEVEVIEGEYGASGIYHINISSNTVLLDKNNNPIDISRFSVGDVVEITYGGQVMLSYPPQIVALKIQIK